jgi:hypothetical protein
MNLFLDSFWRAVAYCLMPQVMALSLLPLCLLIVSSGLGIYFFWDTAVSQLQTLMGDWALLSSVFKWFDELGAQGLRSVMAPLGLLMLVLPIIIVLSLLSVSWLMTPAMVRLVAQRRFEGLKRLHGGSFVQSMAISLGLSLLTLVALIISMPLWLLPPLVVVLPPLLWGWLAYRINSFDVLAEHASTQERHELMQRHRYSLLFMGVLTGFLGAAPGMVWTVGAMAVVFAPLLVPLAIWIYTLVFAFSVLWFTHFCLSALQALRAEISAEEGMPTEATSAKAPELLTDAHPHDHHI